MNESKCRLLDLPNEILLTILRNLNSVDVLYLLFYVGNERLNYLAQDKILSSTLDFASVDHSLLTYQQKLDQFCLDILPRISSNVWCLIVEPIAMERILLAADYSNLTRLKILNFEQKVAFKYLTDQSPLRNIFEKRITDLILTNSDNVALIESGNIYTKNVYQRILRVFRNLKHLTIIEASNSSYPPLRLLHLPSTTFSSSVLTYLCIKVYTLDDCLLLLDGRLEQLTTLIVHILCINAFSSISHKKDSLPNLKYLSMNCNASIDRYDEMIVPLLHRMSHLEKLTLYLCIKNRSRYIDHTHLRHEIIFHMPQLHSFTFYISTYIEFFDSSGYTSLQDIQQININHKHQSMATIINHIIDYQTICSIFSLPFPFDRLHDIGNLFPDIIFNKVTHLMVHDIVAFNHEFFIRVARSFPLLTHLHLINSAQQSSSNSQTYSIIEYPHLVSLDVRFAHMNYIEQFLSERKAYVPRLTELTVVFNELAMATNHFTREELRNNCANVKRLFYMSSWAHPKDFYLFFPCYE